jgi:two-component system, LytTR family, response regulator
MLRAIVIDDESAGIVTLKVLIERNQELIRLIASTLNPEMGIVYIEDYKPDVVFLDISMPGMSGFTLLSKLTYRDFKLVFTTAHKEYAIEAIKNGAFDYLLKPISDEDFKTCVHKIINERQQIPTKQITTSTSFIEINVKDGIIYMKQKDIIRLEASRSYTVFYLDNGIKHVASRSIKEFEEKLDVDIFYRCHKSHIINLHKVQKFVNHDGFFALMTDGSMSDISKTYKDSFLARLKQIKT